MQDCSGKSGTTADYTPPSSSFLSAMRASWSCPFQKQLKRSSTSGAQDAPGYLMWGLTLKPLLVVSGYGIFMHMAHFSRKALEQQSQVTLTIRTNENYAWHSSLHCTSYHPTSTLQIEWNSTEPVYMMLEQKNSADYLHPQNDLCCIKQVICPSIALPHSERFTFRSALFKRKQNEHKTLTQQNVPKKYEVLLRSYSRKIRKHLSAPHTISR